MARETARRLDDCRLHQFDAGLCGQQIRTRSYPAPLKPIYCQAVWKLYRSIFRRPVRTITGKRKTGRPYGTACLFILHVGYALFPHFYIAFVYLALSVCSYVVQCNVKTDCLASTIIITSLTKTLNCRYILFRGGLNVKFDFFTWFKHSPFLKNKKSCNCYFVASSRLKRTSMRILLVLRPLQNPPKIP